MPTVVVLPVPLTPTISTTCGARRSAIGVSTAAKIVADLLPSPGRAGLAPRAAALATASTIRSVAATPTSAEISSSSSASIVSTSTGRLRCVGLVGAADDLVEPLDDLLLRARERLLDLVEKTHASPAILALRLPPAARRSISASTASRGDRSRPSSTAAICAAIGSSTPWRAPSASAAPVVRTPSATIFMLATGCRAASGRAPSSMPTWRLRLRSPVHVSTRSPRPLRPGERLAPAARGARQPRDLGQAARDQRGHARCARGRALRPRRRRSR